MSCVVDFGAATVATLGVCGSGELSDAVSEHCATNRKEGNSDARLEMQSKPPQGQMTSRPFSRDEEKRNPLWDGSEMKLKIDWKTLGRMIWDAVKPVLLAASVVPK